MSHLVAVRPIRTEQDFDAAVQRISDLMEAEEGGPEFDELQVLASLVTEYERRVRPVPDATPIEVVRFVMEDRDMSASDLAIYFGSQPRVSEFLAGKRDLTVEQIRRLSEGLGIPAAALIGSSESRWRVPLNRYQRVLDVVARESLPGNYTLFRLRCHFGGREAGGLTAAPGLLGSSDYEVLTENEIVYMPPECNGHVFPCEIVDGAVLVSGYKRRW